MPNRVGIENRPAIVDQKSRIGDWEADTIIGKDQKSALLTLVERVTRYTIICKLDNLKAEDTARAAIRALKAHKARVHTITMDNGKEFYQHTKIAKALKAENYFCRPYHSWEKGLNENTNGLIIPWSWVRTPPDPPNLSMTWISFFSFPLSKCAKFVPSARFILSNKAA